MNFSFGMVLFAFGFFLGLKFLEFSFWLFCLVLMLINGMSWNYTDVLPLKTEVKMKSIVTWLPAVRRVKLSGHPVPMLSSSSMCMESRRFPLEVHSVFSWPSNSGNIGGRRKFWKPGSD